MRDDLEPTGGNFYRPHYLLVTSGEFWRCKHGYTSLAEVECPDCAFDDPVAYEKWYARMFGKSVNKSASCPSCDGTGDVHRSDGEWLGYCDCQIGADAENRNIEAGRKALEPMVRYRPIKRNTGKSFVLKLWKPASGE